jgi:hypothetical protein
VDFEAGVVRLDPGTTKNDEGSERYAITDKAVMEEGVQKPARFHARDRGESAAVSIRHGT